MVGGGGESALIKANSLKQNIDPHKNNKTIETICVRYLILATGLIWFTFLITIWYEKLQRLLSMKCKQKIEFHRRKKNSLIIVREFLIISNFKRHFTWQTPIAWHQTPKRWFTKSFDTSVVWMKGRHVLCKTKCFFVFCKTVQPFRALR